jgi:hypothetical protein
MTGLETGGRIWVVCTIPIVYVLAYAGEPTSIQTNTSTPGLAVCKSFDAAQLQITPGSWVLLVLRFHHAPRLSSSGILAGRIPATRI